MPNATQTDLRRRATAIELAVLAVLAAVVLVVAVFAQQGKENGFKVNKLTPEEERVIIHKGTERAFTGEYWDHKEVGTYHCRRCDAALYRSESKFDSGCGWPSFDEELPGAVVREPDEDGRRTEILCARCGGHLGHVFLGEGFTKKNTRHCVNSISMKFVPAPKEKAMSAAKTETAIFAGGCFWGVEYLLAKEEGVTSTSVGYIGGHKANPTYKEVCYTDTGHAEAVAVIFDPTKTSFEKLARVFFEIHDPTQVDRQGPDIGKQYRSVVFYTTPEQKAITEKLIGELKAKGYRVATAVQEATEFWDAEDYHQDYYLKNNEEPYCHRRVKRF